MIVEAHSRLKVPERRDATRVIVKDDHGNIIAVFLQWTPMSIEVRVRGQKGFDEALKLLGITQVVTVEDLADRIPQNQ